MERVRMLFFVLVFGFLLGSVLSAQDAAPAAEAAMTAETVVEEAPALDTGSTAWIIVATALVFFMTMPGLGMFYGGLVKRKNVLSILMQCFATIALVSILWVAVGYTLAFSDKPLFSIGGVAIVGDFSYAFLNGITPETLSGGIPTLIFAMFQCMFAVITPALIVGAFAERFKFSSFLIFTGFWLVLVYAPVAHAVWNANGYFFQAGALDFAGGTVVHINAGIAALAAAIILGKRKYLKPTPPHNLTYTIIGAAMLWFGWFGFNAGSGLAANGLAASAFVVTNTATAVAAFAWFVIDWIVHKKPTILGAATGAVAGLVAITPAAGFVDVAGSIVIGLASTIFCYIFVVYVKPKAGYDDALDAFGVHGIGGIVGALLTGIFANPIINSAGVGTLYGNPGQFGIQLGAVVFTLVFSFVLTFIILKVIDLIMGARVKEKDEAIGLDVTQHNERAYTVIE